MKFYQHIALAIAPFALASQLHAFEIEQDSGQLIVKFSVDAKDVNYQYKLPEGCTAKVKVEKTQSKLKFSHLGHCTSGAVLTVEYPLSMPLKANLGAGRIEVQNAVIAENFFNRIFVEASVGMANVPSLSGWNLVQNNWVGRSYEKVVRTSDGPQANFVVSSGVINVNN